MNKLPSEIIINLLSRLPIKSLLRCRCVCKSWFNLTHDSLLISLHLNQSSQNENNVGVIFVSSILVNPTYLRTRLCFIDNNGADDYTCVDINLSLLPYFDEFEVRGSCNGLLCLFDPITKILKFICNPCNGEYAPLPNAIRSSKAPARDIAVGFGYLPESKIYKVIEIVYYNNYKGDSWSGVHVFTLGDGSWRDIGAAPFSLRGKCASEAFVNGAIHWISSGYDGPGLADRIVSFDVDEEQFGVIPNPEFESGQLNYRLGVLRGCLSAANFEYGHYAELWVMNEYGVKESWSKYFRIICSEVGLRIGYLRALCFRKCGEVLLLHGSSSLLSYDPKTKRLTELKIAGLPPAFQVVTHVGSLVSPRSLLGEGQHSKDCLVDEKKESMQRVEC